MLSQSWKNDYYMGSNREKSHVTTAILEKNNQISHFEWFLMFTSFYFTRWIWKKPAFVFIMHIHMDLILIKGFGQLYVEGYSIIKSLAKE